MRQPLTLAISIVIGLTGSATAAWPCSIVMAPVPSPMSNAELLVAGSDLIVRVVAAEYERPPANPNLWTTGEPDSLVRFQIVELIKGVESTRTIVIAGYLVDGDDFNDRPAPYDFVRPGGRSGSCFANSYRRGGQFLLMLKRLGPGAYTPNWFALAPVNEQLRSEDDPWVVWVRNQVWRDKREEPDLEPKRLRATYAVYSAVIGAMANRAIPLRGLVGTNVTILGRTITPSDKGAALRSGSQRQAISDEMRADFANGLALQFPVVRRFAIAREYELIPLARLNEAGLAFSSVGFDTDLDRAVLYVHFRIGFDVGNGFYALLKQSAGSWTIERVIPLWEVGR